MGFVQDAPLSGQCGDLLLAKAHLPLLSTVMLGLLAGEEFLPAYPLLLMLGVAAVALTAASSNNASAQQCTTMRKINIGVSVAPPNVVHTSPYVAKELGYFAKRCIDANIVQFEGGQSQTSNVAAAQGTAIVSVSDVSIGRGLKVQQIWGLAPRMPQAYMVSPDVKKAADLKGKPAVDVWGLLKNANIV